MLLGLCSVNELSLGPMLKAHAWACLRQAGPRHPLAVRVLDTTQGDTGRQRNTVSHRHGHLRADGSALSADWWVVNE